MVQKQENVKEVTVPKYLYKIITMKDWQASLSTQMVKLTSHDDKFIHLATDEQVPKVISKYWMEVPEAVVLKLDAHKLKGKLVKETNPGGTNEYFHLYSGAIPLDAVVDVAVFHPKQQSKAKKPK